MRKGKLSRKVFALLLSLAMVVTMMPTMALTAFANENDVAQIGTGEKTYTSLADAINSAQSGDTIKLLADVTASEDESGMIWFMGKTGNFTLDCNGHTLIGGVTDGYYGSADLTIKGFKSIETTYSNDETGKMSQMAALWNYANDMVVEDGEFTATNAVVMQYGGTVELKDGTYIMKGEDGPVVLSLGGKTTIRGGTYKGAENLTKVCAICAAEDGAVDVYGGTFEGYLEEQDNGQINIYGGTFSVDPTDYVAEGYAAVKSGSNWVVKSYDDAVVAQIGEQKYLTLAAAYAAANDGDHIEILVDEIELTDVPSAKKNITVSGLTDENGKPATKVTKWTANTGSRNDGCTFENFIVTEQIYGFAGNNTTIKNCRFTGSNGFRTTYAYGLLTIDNCDFDTTIYGIHFDGGTGNVVVKNSKISGFNTFAASLDSLTFDNCEFLGRNKAYSVVQTWGKMIIKNSTFDDAFFSGTCYVGTTQAGCSVTMENVKMAEGSSKTLGDALIGAEDASYTAMDVTKDASGKFTAGKLIGGSDAETYLPTLLADGYIIVAGENGWYDIKHVEVKVEPAVVDDDNKITVGGEEITVEGAGEQGQPTAQEAATAITNTLDNPEVTGFAETNIDSATPATKKVAEKVDGYDLSIVLNEVRKAANGQAADNDTIKVNEQTFTDTDVKKLITVDLTAASVETVADVTTTTTVTSMTFDVTPVASITVTNGEETSTITAKIPKDAITAPITFRLPVANSVSEKWAAVYHEDSFMGNYEIKNGINNSKYIEVSSKEFSKFKYVLVNSTSAEATIGEVPYQTFAEAVAAVENGETIVLQKDVNDEEVVFNRVVTFIVDPNNHVNQAKKIVESGYSLEITNGDGNITIYKVTEATEDPVGLTPSQKFKIKALAAVGITAATIATVSTVAAIVKKAEAAEAEAAKMEAAKLLADAKEKAEQALTEALGDSTASLACEYFNKGCAAVTAATTADDVMTATVEYAGLIGEAKTVLDTKLYQYTLKANKNGKIKVSFENPELDGTVNYQVVRSTKKDFSKNKKTYTVKVKDQKTLTLTNAKNLKKDTRYYYKVRAKVQLSDGTEVWTDWSNVRNAKCKKTVK